MSIEFSATLFMFVVYPWYIIIYLINSSNILRIKETFIQFNLFNISIDQNFEEYFVLLKVYNIIIDNLIIQYNTINGDNVIVSL